MGKVLGKPTSSLLLLGDVRPVKAGVVLGVAVMLSSCEWARGEAK